MAIVPAGHRVLIEDEKVEQKTTGGIILPDAVRDKEARASMRGTVIAIGETAWKGFDDGLPWAAVGDKVVFARYAGVTIEDDGKELRLCNDEDIIAVIKEA